MLPPELAERIDELARVPTILVASDYDGTLAPIVEVPSEARPSRESVAALRSLAALSGTHVAVVSGRSLRDLAALSRLPDEIHLVGSHGSEFDVGFIGGLSDEQAERRRRIIDAMSGLVGGDPGFEIERKPASVAFHYRRASPDAAAEALAALERFASDDDGIQVKTGKKVLELSVVTTDKGQAIDRLRRLVAAEAVLFLGDDVTDEDAFATLRGPDVGVKVGEGASLAEYRVPATDDAARVLARLCEARLAWLEGHQAPPIERHALLSDQRTMALLTPEARVSWLCFPRVDSGAVFAELVGGPGAGYFAVRPERDLAPIGQRYLDDTLVVETRWPDLRVTDYLDTSGGRVSEAAGRTDLVRVVEGTGAVVVELAPRIDYGRAPTEIQIVDDGLRIAGTGVPMVLRAPGVEWTVEHDGHMTAHGRAVLGGEPLVLELRLGTDATESAAVAEPARRAETFAEWSRWADRLRLPRVEPELVRRSALTLKGLCYGPTGAILAAATTSLPEEIGGVRNWDYRYCWPRDASLTAAALVSLGSMGEALSFLSWLLERVDALAHPSQLRPVYAPVGDDSVAEAVIPTLSGYRGSRPVRVGNAAEHQLQLDMFGPIVDLIHQIDDRGVPVSADAWRVVEAMVRAVGQAWREPDHGIWEERRPRRHHVHSKVMCWQAVDRAIRIAERGRFTADDSWVQLRDDIAADVLTHGYDPERGAFTIAYGDPELDAAVLQIGLTGLLDPQDGRFVSTVRAIERELREGPIVYRYRLDDGLPGFEGGFFICSFWLVEAYVRIGWHDEARSLFKRLTDLVGPTGLLPEQYDPRHERLLGNHPQAYSHLGLVNAALALDRAG